MSIVNSLFSSLPFSLFNLGILISSALLTGLTRVFAIRQSILDIPNARSSHYVPTPRGGGIAIVMSFMGALFYLIKMQLIELPLAYALLGGGLIIAACGYADDLNTLPARFRIILHFVAATWGVYWLGGFPLSQSHYMLNFVGYLIAVIGTVWCVNLYNFMDGIDGLAGSEGIFVAVVTGMILLYMGVNSSANIMFIFAASILGFILWNWPPAKIFLGDVGSGFIGYVFAIFSLYTINQHFLSLAFWLIISAAFFLDATFTLIYRIIQKKKWYSAHREHAYQKLILLGLSHEKVTSLYVILNLILLLPLAWLSLAHPTQTLWYTIMLLTGLLIIWLSINHFCTAKVQAN